MNYSNRSLLSLSFALFSLSLTATAQDSTPTPTPSSTSSEIIVGEGISGYADRKERNPTLSVRTVTKAETVQILVDAYIKNKDFENDPVKFDFYINRQLFTSQIRSTELPGPVGVDIGTDIAVPPFNYSVVATLLHPNRAFTTIVHGAVFPSSLATTFASCEVTLSTTEGDLSAFSLEDVTSAQDTSTSFSLSIEDAKSAATEENPDGESLDLSTTVTLDGEEANATLLVTRGDSTNSYDVTGNVEKTDGKLSKVELSNEDLSVSLVCE